MRPGEGDALMRRQPRGASSASSSRTPWLLQTDKIFASRAMAEFIGTLLLQLLVGTTSDPVRIAAAFTGLMACFARHSGGHLNPAVSLAAGLSGHMAPSTAAAYMLAQVLGAVVGAALLTWLVPGLALGQTFASSCHAPSVAGLGGTALFAWETAATFAFVYVLYPSLFSRPGFGVLGPLMAGVTLFGAVATAGAFTSFSPLNPALTIAGSLVFDCSWHWMWMFLLAHLTGAGLAALLAVGVFGVGPMFLTEAERSSDYAALPGSELDAPLSYRGTADHEPGASLGALSQPPAGPTVMGGG